MIDSLHPRHYPRTPATELTASRQKMPIVPCYTSFLPKEKRQVQPLAVNATVAASPTEIGLPRLQKNPNRNRPIDFANLLHSAHLNQQLPKDRGIERDKMMRKARYEKMEANYQVY